MCDTANAQSESRSRRFSAPALDPRSSLTISLATGGGEHTRTPDFSPVTQLQDPTARDEKRKQQAGGWECNRTNRCPGGRTATRDPATRRLPETALQRDTGKLDGKMCACQALTGDLWGAVLTSVRADSRQRL